MYECVICGKPVERGIPRWVIDWDTLEVKGQAHTKCVKKSERHGDMRFYPTETPRPGMLAFTAKLRAFLIAHEAKYTGRWPSYEFHQYLLANEGLFKASTREQWANLDRVKTLTNWWLNGSKIITQDEYNSLFEWIASFDTSERRTPE